MNYERYVNQATDVAISARATFAVGLPFDLPDSEPNSENKPVDRLSGLETIDAIREGVGIPLLIPRAVLHGTQTINEYDPKIRRAIEKMLQLEGTAFLLRNPLLVCSLIDQGTTTLATIDGHHRLRYSGKFKIPTLPSLVVTVEELTRLYNKMRKNGEGELSSAYVRASVLRDVAIALHSFDLPREKQPSVINNVPNTNALKQLYSGFPISRSNVVFDSVTAGGGF